MSWKTLCDPKIQNFIIDHQNDDVKTLALKKPPEGAWPYPLILDQIKARQKATKKMPNWFTSNANLIFPPPELIEQASSETASLYKAKLAQHLCLSTTSFMDLTAGTGMDTLAFAKIFETGICIEKDETANQILEHNLRAFGQGHIQTQNTNAEEYLKRTEKVDLIFCDPQRRNAQKRGIYALSECSPNILELLPSLRNKTHIFMLKTSPVLDITKTIEDLEVEEQNYTRAVHIIEHNGECKEVLYILDFKNHTEPNAVEICAVSLDAKGQSTHKLSFSAGIEKSTVPEYTPPKTYLFEPGPAFMKSGAFHCIAKTYTLSKLHPDTHLYTSNQDCKNFPGRRFEILDILAADKKTLKKALPSMQANLSIRNFPGSVESLKKKLGLKDGGNTYVFAATLSNGNKILMLCKKSSNEHHL